MSFVSISRFKRQPITDGERTTKPISQIGEILKISARERMVARQKHPPLATTRMACAFNNLNRGSSA